MNRIILFALFGMFGCSSEGLGPRDGNDDPNIGEHPDNEDRADGDGNSDTDTDVEDSCYDFTLRHLPDAVDVDGADENVDVSDATYAVVSVKNENGGMVASGEQFGSFDEIELKGLNSCDGPYKLEGFYNGVGDTIPEFDGKSYIVSFGWQWPDCEVLTGGSWSIVEEGEEPYAAPVYVDGSGDLDCEAHDALWLMLELPSM